MEITREVGGGEARGTEAAAGVEAMMPKAANKVRGLNIPDLSSTSAA